MRAKSGGEGGGGETTLHRGNSYGGWYGGGVPHISVREGINEAIKAYPLGGQAG